MIVAHIKGHCQIESVGYHLANGFNYLNCKILPIIGKLNFIWYNNYHLSQKTKLLENDGFNHLTDILTLHITCVPNLPSISEAQQLKFLSF